ncbi:MAG: hypothetical protein ACI4OY_00765 [Aristaeellaceae bacterium]
MEAAEIAASAQSWRGLGAWGGMVCAAFSIDMKNRSARTDEAACPQGKKSHIARSGPENGGFPQDDAGEGIEPQEMDA